MKKFILALAAMSMIATPAMAQHRSNHYRYDSYQRHHRDRVSTGEAVAIGIGALILGAAIANSNRNTRVERYEQPVQRRQQQYVCQDVIQYDYYGNPYVSGRNCWYQ